MADAAAKLAAKLAELERRLAAMERGQQFQHSTIDVGGEELILPDALTQGVEANAMSQEALAASTELDTRLTTAEGDLTDSKGRLDAAEADIVDAFGELGTVDDRIGAAKGEAISTSADDAAAKAAAAKAEAIQAAASDAQTKADAALAAANAQVAQVIAKGQSLIRNGDFEGGNDGWPTSSFYGAETTTARSGSKSLRIGPNPGGNIWPVSEWVPGGTDRTYYVEGYYKRSGEEVKAQGVGFVLQAQTAAGGTATFTIGKVDSATISTSSWTKVTATYKLTTADAVKVRFAPWIIAGNNVYYVDDIRAFDVTEAQAALDAANTAQSAANAAQTAAGNAQTTADNALTMAGSKGKVYYSTAAPSGTGTAAGDLWRKIDASKNVIGEWYWTGSAWQSSQITTEAISNLDVGKLTAGSAAILTVTAQKIAASTAAFQTVDVRNLFATSGTMDTAVIDKLWTDVVNSRKITTGMLLVGRGSNLINWTPGDVSLFVSQSNGGGSTYYAISDSDAGGQAVRVQAPNVTPGTFQYTTEISSGTTAANGQANAYDIEPGASYRIQMRATFGGTVAAPATTQPTVRVMVRYFDGTNATIKDVIDAAGAGKAAYTGALVTWEDKAPANAVAARIYLQQDQPSTATGHLYLSLFGFYKKTSSVLIEDGAVTAEKLEAQLVLTNEVIAGNPTGNHAKLDANGFRVMAPPSAGADPVEVIRLGTETDDYFGVVGADGNLTASITAEGGVSAKAVNVADTLTLGGEDLGSKIDYMPQRLVAWGQVPIDTATAKITGAGEIGLYELGWDSNQAAGRDSRMYQFSTSPLLIRSSVIGQVGIKLYITTDGSKPTITSPVIQYAYGWVGVANGYTSFSINRLIGSNNGEYIRVLVALWNGTSGTASVVADGNQTHMFSSVVDLGGSLSPTAIASTGGGTTGTKAPVTTTKEYRASSIKSFDGSGNFYNYNTGYMYSGLSPAGYGDLRSVAVFPSFTADLSGATVNDVWIYVYYDFWYYGSGGNAAISLHGYSSQPASNPSLSFSTMSNSWPRAAGRWVRLPDSTYAGFKSGSWKGFGLGGHGGGYTEYGYAHDARIKIRYTK